MKKIDTNNKSKQELGDMLNELRATLIKLNFDLADKKLNNPMQLSQTKKDIARVLTAINT